MINFVQVRFQINKLVSNRLLRKISKLCLYVGFTLSLALSAINTVQADNSVVAARVWPAQDYTRITLESSKPFIYKMSMIQNPERIVLDVENIELNSIIKSLTDKILASDPYIKQIRVANYQQNVVRLVVDLKAEVKPNAFTLEPNGEYKYRLVLDVYPVKDPLMAMLAQRENATAVDNNTSNSNDAAKPIIIVEPLPPQQPEANEPSGTAETSKSGEVIKSVEVTKQAIVATTKPEINNQAVQTSGQTIEKKNVASNADVKTTEAKSTETKKTGRQIIIAIDAGHGGEDPGARGANGSREKDITLMVAKRLKNKIDEEPNMRAVLTRDSDYFIPLHGRVVKARKLQADLFVSIHCNSSLSSKNTGFEVYFLSPAATDRAGPRPCRAPP